MIVYVKNMCYLGNYKFRFVCNANDILTNVRNMFVFFALEYFAAPRDRYISHRQIKAGPSL